MTSPDQETAPTIEGIFHLLRYDMLPRLNSMESQLNSVQSQMNSMQSQMNSVQSQQDRMASQLDRLLDAAFHDLRADLRDAHLLHK
jgi:chromosome segregation ATPase